MSKSDANSVAIVTGSTSGIGLEIAKKLASLKYNIVLNGFIDPNSSNSLIKFFETEYSIKVIYSSADVTKPIHVEELFSLANSLGQIDVLVNNAGIQYVSPIEDFPNDKWCSIIDTNLTGAFYCAKQAIKMMKKSGFGRIINIASAHALVASPYKSAYVAAKHGLIGLTKSIALEVAELNITVNAICPGYVETPLVLNQIDSLAKVRNISREEVINNILLTAQVTKKFVKASEVAAMVSYLCSGEASSITGTSISIDGGWTAH